MIVLAIGVAVCTVVFIGFWVLLAAEQIAWLINDSRTRR